MRQAFIYPLVGMVGFVIASGVMWWRTDVSDEDRVMLPPVVSPAAVEQARKEIRKVDVEVSKMEQARKDMESTLANLARAEALKQDVEQLSERVSDLPHPTLLRDPGRRPSDSAGDSVGPSKVIEAYHNETGISPEHIGELMNRSR